MQNFFAPVVLALCALAPLAPQAQAAPPNILFIAVDDLNDWIGCLGGHPQALTPHMDRLAQRGTLFSNAHCQAPLCNPSRSSLLTGRRPSSTGIYGLSPHLRTVPETKSLVTLPGTFTAAGWTTFTCGKIFHGFPPKANPQAEFQTWATHKNTPAPAKPFANLPGKPHPLMDWGPVDQPDEQISDYITASQAIEAIQKAPKDQPFFVACGFHLPHVALHAPKAWFDKFPLEKVQLPPVLDTDRDDIPRFSWYLHWKLPEPRLSTLRERNEWLPLVRAYLACTAFMDAQVGRLLDTLEQTGTAANTLVVLWSDHGWHLGEKLITGKNTLWERSTRVPLIFAGPGVTPGGRCTAPAELLDIFPTLLEATGMPARPDLEGHSLVPQLRDASAPRPWPAITTANQNNHSIRTDRWRYIRYADGSEELYDLQADPKEWHNLAALPAHAQTKAELAQWLPKTNLASADPAGQRVLLFDPATGALTWEGKSINPGDPVPDDH